MRIRNILLIGLAAILLANPTWGASVSGCVFFDKNNDGLMSPGDKPIAGAVVSDGHNVVTTSSSGKYLLETEPTRIVFVSLPRGYRAAKNFYALAGTNRSLDFPMALWPASKTDAVRFAQITDIHVTGNTTVRTFIRDLDEINTMDPGVEFILATGDLVNNGNNVSEYENYLRAIASSKLPVFNLPGNHDALDAARMANYKRFLGPEYYSFNVGNCHIVALNCMALDDKQKEWISKDLEKAPKGSRRIFAMHYMPTQEQLDYLGNLNAVAVLSGHKHGDRVHKSSNVLDINTPPLRFGGIDRTARCFRVVDISKGKVKSTLRFGGFRHHAVIVAPTGSCIPRNGKLQVVVNTYDSRCDVTAVECLIGSRRVPLKQVSAWSWIGEIAVFAKSGANQRITAEIHDTKGHRWLAEANFRVENVPNDKQRPLRFAAAAPTGGLIGFSSPKSEDGMVAIGVQDIGDLKGCGVRVFDRDLALKWDYQTDSAVKNNTAISKSHVYAASIAGSLYALDRMTGRPVWTADLDRKRGRWETSAAVAEEGTVFVGGSSYIAAFNETLGKPIWTTSLTKGDSWPNSYVVPVIAGGRLILMTRGGAHAFDAKSGKPLWTLAGSFHGGTVSDGTIYTILNNTPAAVDLAAGKLLWSGEDQVGDSASLPTVSSDKMVVGTADGRVCAYARKDGALLWSFQAGPSLTSLQPYKRDLSDVNSSPAIAGDIVYVGASDGVLYALSLATGEKLDSYAIGSPIASSMLISNGRLYFGAYDGNLYAFNIAQ